MATRKLHARSYRFMMELDAPSTNAYQKRSSSTMRPLGSIGICFIGRHLKLATHTCAVRRRSLCASVGKAGHPWVACRQCDAGLPEKRTAWLPDEQLSGPCAGRWPPTARPSWNQWPETQPWPTRHPDAGRSFLEIKKKMSVIRPVIQPPCSMGLHPPGTCACFMVQEVVTEHINSNGEVTQRSVQTPHGTIVTTFARGRGN